jgi:NitT/TauT family transport system permease protein
MSRRPPLGSGWIDVILGMMRVAEFYAAIRDPFAPAPTRRRWVGRHRTAGDSAVFAADFGRSCERVFGGFVAAIIVSIPIGILMGNFRIIEAAVEPFLAFVRYMLRIIRAM